MTRPAISLDDTSELATVLEGELRSGGSALPPECRVPPRLLDRALFRPLLYAARQPGKQFRGRLAEVAWELADGVGTAPVELALIVEALHLGSLIVDDIEDGSDQRRGAPSLHRAVGLPLALNAGNWLYFWPGIVLERSTFTSEIKLAMHTAVSRAVLRCHYGQALDLSTRVGELRRREVSDVVYATTRLKTGSLMELAAELGALAAGASPTKLEVLAALGRDIGVALQMLDDWTGLRCARRRHKGREDLLASRASWPWAWLAERTDSVSYRRFRTALESVTAGELDPDLLADQLCEAIGDHAPTVIRAKLDSALSLARRVLGETKGILELESELERLERYDG